MSLRWLEGFELEGSQNMYASLAMKWTGGSHHAMSFAAVQGRYGGKAVNLAASRNLADTLTTPTLPSNDTWLVGFSWRPQATLHGTLLQILSTEGIEQISIRTTPGQVGKLLVYRGDGVLLQTFNAGTQVGHWQTVELKVKISVTDGLVDMRVNGQSIAAPFNGNTYNRSASKPMAGAFRFQGILGNIAGYDLDDVYICDKTGQNTDFIPIAQNYTIKAIIPNGKGHYTEWQVVGARQNWMAVDSLPVNLSTFIYSSHLGKTDTYQFSDLSLTAPTIVGSVVGVMYNVACKRDTGKRNTPRVRLLARSDTDYLMTPWDITNTQFFFQCITQEINPITTMSWTVPDLDALELGIQLDDGNTPLTAYVALLGIEIFGSTKGPFDVISQVPLKLTGEADVQVNYNFVGDTLPKHLTGDCQAKAREGWDLEFESQGLAMELTGEGHAVHTLNFNGGGMFFTGGQGTHRRLPNRSL